MERNDILNSLDLSSDMSEKALIIPRTLDTLVSALLGRLIAERLIDYAGQPGQTIEYLAACIGDTLVESLDKIDTVEMKRLWDKK